MEINQKLFEEVIGYKVKDLKLTIDQPDSIVWSEANYKGISPYCKAINKHHYAHKCKEWAKHKGYQLISGCNNMSDYITYTYYTNNYPEHDSINYGLSEPEAVFKATQWVYDNIKQ